MRPIHVWDPHSGPPRILLLLWGVHIQIINCMCAVYAVVDHHDCPMIRLTLILRACVWILCACEGCVVGGGGITVGWGNVYNGAVGAVFREGNYCVGALMVVTIPHTAFRCHGQHRQCSCLVKHCDNHLRCEWLCSLAHNSDHHLIVAHSSSEAHSVCPQHTKRGTRWSPRSTRRLWINALKSPEKPGSS